MPSSSNWNTLCIEQLVLIDSRTRYVTSLVRDAPGLWMPPVVSENTGTLEFTPLAITLALDKIYQNTSLA